MHLKITGEYITDAARTLLYQQNNMEGAIEFLVDAIDPDDNVVDDMAYETRLGIALQILDGKARITGVSDEDMYIEETPDHESLGALKQTKILAKRLAAMEEKVTDLEERISFIASSLRGTSYERTELEFLYREAFGEGLFDDLADREPNPFVDTKEAQERFLSRMERQTDTREHSTGDYGWLEPDGTFHEIEWGEHQEWAKRYCDEHYPPEKYSEMYLVEPDENGHQTYYLNGDFLIYRLHWVLLDSPYQGIAKPQHSGAFTKAQKEFLYDYYRERGQFADADALWKEESF